MSHSLSPLLHQVGYEACGLAQWTYQALEVAQGGLAEFVASLDEQWRGLSLTMPLKEEALLLADHSSALALQVGSANTLVRCEDGAWAAQNTDVAGVMGALAGPLASLPAVDRAVVIGSGATARAVLAALHLIGVTEVAFVVRGQARESTLAQARDHGVDPQVYRLDQPAQDWADARLLVNTTPAGGSQLLAGTLPATAAPPDQVVLDVLYADWPTSFAQACAQRGARVICGVEMLVHQAAAQFTLMTGLPAPLEPMLAAGRRAVEHPEV